MFNLKTLADLTSPPDELMREAVATWAAAPGDDNGKPRWLWRFITGRARARLARGFGIALARVRDQVIFDCGGRETSPMYEPDEWDAELDAALDAEFCTVVDAALPVREAFVGVGFGRGAVDADTIAAEMAAIFDDTVWGEPLPVDFALAGLPAGFYAQFVSNAAVAPPPPPAHPPLAGPPPPLPGARRGPVVAKHDEAEAFRDLFAALQWDAGEFAAILDVSVGTVRNYAAGRSVPRKPLTATQARKMHEFAMQSAARLQRAAEVFAAAATLAPEE